MNNEKIRDLLFWIPGGLVMLSSLATAVDYKLAGGEHVTELVGLTVLAAIYLARNLSVYGKTLR